MAPHLKHGLVAVGGVVHQDGAFDDVDVGIEHVVEVGSLRVDPCGVARLFVHRRDGNVAEIITGIDCLGIVFLTDHSFEHFGRADDGDVARLVHVADGDLRLAEEVDPVGGGAHIPGINGDYPAIEPAVGTFLGHHIFEVTPYFGSLVDGPGGIATPGEVDPSLALRHAFLAEVGLPTCNLRTSLDEDVFNRLDVGIAEIGGLEVACSSSAQDLVVFGKLNQNRIDIAKGILHVDFLLELFVPKSSPSFHLLGFDEIGVVEETCCSAHVTDGIVADTKRGIGEVELVVVVWSHLLEFLCHERGDIS